MAERIPLDPLAAPLSGVNLVEAGAGAGKTHTLACLYTRLVLETDIPVERICVVTYTRAATKELRARVLLRLMETRAVVSGESPGEGSDPFVRSLAARDDGGFLARLEAAARNFDEARIFTIHGFCQRALKDNALLAGIDPESEIQTDPTDLITEAARDFWRAHFTLAPPLVLAHALINRRGPEHFTRLLATALARPGALVVPREPPPDLGILTVFAKKRGEFKSAWQEAREEARGILLEDKGLNGTVYGTRDTPDKNSPTGASKRETRVEALCAEMDKWVDAPGPGHPLPEHFDRFSAAYITEKTRKNHKPPAHPLFLACQDLHETHAAVTDTLNRLLLHLDARFLTEGKERLERHKKRAGVLFYDDLAQRLREALAGPQGDALARSLQNEYSAALIDEFQDTDPSQLAIFQRIFTAPGKTLFFIGDPKQAIYGFRGADLHAYLKAAPLLERTYWLRENWRSAPGLVSAVNTLFSMRHKEQFLTPGVTFAPAVPAPRPEEPFQAGQGGRLRLWWLPVSGEEPLSKAMAARAAVRAVAAEVTRLVTLAREGKARIGARPLEQGDLAVLVRTNRQAVLVQEALLSQGINAILQSTGSLFATPEARDMLAVLRAVAAPGQGGKIRGALATRTMGWTGGEIFALGGDSGKWEEVLRLFTVCRDTFQSRGFIRMFHFFLQAWNLPARILAVAGGERRLTNVLHLSEALNRASREEHLGLGSLVQWLERRVADPGLGGEEHQLRLESDAKAVQVVTVHRSKGLEYPVVFCPFVWDPGREMKLYANLKRDKGHNLANSFEYHDPARDNALVLDLGTGDEEGFRLAQCERMAEDVRLFYVAVTRARHAAYLAWGKVSGAEKTAPARLWYPAGENESPVSDAARVSGLSASDMEEALSALAARNPEITRVPLPEAAPGPLPPLETGGESLECRMFTGQMDRSFRIASFSWMTSQGGPEAGERLVPDPAPPAAPPPAPPKKPGTRDIHSFPAGANAGVMLHALFERLDFTAGTGEAELLARETLLEHGFEEDWTRVVADMVREVLACPLLADIPELCLKNVGRRDRSDEMEFLFPLKPVTADRLAGVFRDHGKTTSGKAVAEAMRTLRFPPVRGFVQGFMDLVFRSGGRIWLVDYKSNRLGADPEDYGQEALDAAMAAHHYHLQYHLYVMALHLHLKRCMPGYDYARDFGGVFYLFLRGIQADAGPSLGVFADRPAAGLVEDLLEVMLDGCGGTESALNRQSRRIQETGVRS
jgi:exodeoxyribonuclease V beta subunit